MAQTEEAAWYALGYEDARDGLLWIQYACKAAKGELYRVVGSKPALTNDIAVKSLRSHLGDLTTTELRSLFAPTNAAIAANFWDNCVAYAAGANAYRDEVKSSTGAAQADLHTWLTQAIIVQGHTLSWVYDDEIDPVDIVSQGGWTGAFWSFLFPEDRLVNSNGFGYTDDESASPSGIDPTLVEDPLAPGSAYRQLEQMRQHASTMPGLPSAMSGSNSFGWSGLYCEDAAGTTYSGLLADPHQGLPFWSPLFTAGFVLVPNHQWFAHVKVTPQGGGAPTLDVFGHVPHGAATFVSCHNGHVAVGGTAGRPNVTDHFVLRLEELPVVGGVERVPHAYYSRYHDVLHNNRSYRPIVTDSVSISRPDGTSVPLTYWRAGSFGVILPDLGLAEAYVKGYPTSTPPPMPIVYGERVDPSSPSPPRWRVDTRVATPKMRYWAAPQQDASGAWTTSPMVVTLRAPMDRGVAGDPRDVGGEARHWLLNRGPARCRSSGAVPRQRDRRIVLLVHSRCGGARHRPATLRRAHERAGRERAAGEPLQHLSELRAASPHPLLPMTGRSSIATEELLMPASPSLSASAWRAVPPALSVLLSMASAEAQHPVLAPTADTAIIVNGALHYSSIHIPAGVTVRFVGPVTPIYVPSAPAVVYCDGDVIVHGTLSLAGDVFLYPPYTPPAGWVTTGEGWWGYVCGTGANAYFSPPEGGSHAGTYGSVIPFSLEGGSNGGWLVRYPWCTGGNFLLSTGGPGGGTLALLAHGRIEIDGAVTADGVHDGTSSPLNNSSGGGSGGSILLRGAGGVTILPGGSVTARGGTYYNAHPTTIGAAGYVRLDAWGTPPIIQGTVVPPPTALELPHLRARSQPRIGFTWNLDILAPENSPIFVAASLQAGPSTMTPFGILGLDPPTSASLAVVIPQPSHDPIAIVPWLVPNAPVLIGLQLWVQALAVPPTLPPRLTNTLSATVG